MSAMRSAPTRSRRSCNVIPNAIHRSLVGMRSFLSVAVDVFQQVSAQRLLPRIDFAALFLFARRVWPQGGLRQADRCALRFAVSGFAGS